MPVSGMGGKRSPPPLYQRSAESADFGANTGVRAGVLAPSRQATETPQEKLIRRLCVMLSEYMDASQIDEVRRAYTLAERSHDGQFRVSGEPYICHPVAVATILASLRMDVKGVMAALLHDVI